MSAHGLLTELRARGVALSTADGRLHVEAPRGIVTPQLRAALTMHKAELLRLLNLCEHVAGDADLADWHSNNPHLTCARCFLAGKPLRRWMQ